MSTASGTFVEEVPYESAAAADWARSGYTGDGRCFVWLEDRPEGGRRLVVNGTPGPPFDRLESVASFEVIGEEEPEPFRLGDCLYTGDDQSRFAYVARRGDRFFVGTGLEEGPEFERILSSPTFSPDCRQMAYAALVDGVERLVLDGRVVTEFQGTGDVIFSPKGDRVAYTAFRGERPDVFVVLDGVAGPAFDLCPIMVFSPDGTRFAYVGRRYSGPTEDLSAMTEVLVLDGEPGPEFSEISGGMYGSHIVDLRFTPGGSGEAPELDRVVFSPDGRRIAYIARRGDVSTLVLDGTLGPFSVLVAAPVFSPDSKRVAYVIRRGRAEKYEVVVDGESGPEADELYGSCRFSPDSRRVAHLAGRLPGWRHPLMAPKGFLVLDGRPGPEFDEVAGPPIFGRDGGHVAFLGRRGKKWFTVQGDDPIMPAFDWVNGPFLSADRHRAAFVVGSGAGQALLVVGDPGPGPECEAILGASRFFTPDGRHVAYAGKLEGGWRPFVDHEMGPSFETLGAPALSAEDRVVFFGTRGDTVYRITYAFD